MGLISTVSSCTTTTSSLSCLGYSCVGNQVGPCIQLLLLNLFTVHPLETKSEGCR